MGLRAKPLSPSSALDTYGSTEALGGRGAIKGGENGREDTTFSHHIPVTDISPGKSEAGYLCWAEMAGIIFSR